MSNQELTDFGIWRAVDDQLDEETRMAAGKASTEAIKEICEERIEVEHVPGDVLEDEG